MDDVLDDSVDIQDYNMEETSSSVYPLLAILSPYGMDDYRWKPEVDW